MYHLNTTAMNISVVFASIMLLGYSLFVAYSLYVRLRDK